MPRPQVLAQLPETSDDFDQDGDMPSWFQEENRNLPENWEAVWDPVHEQVYYFNHATMESTWTRPRRPGEEESFPSEGGGEVVESPSPPPGAAVSSDARPTGQQSSPGDEANNGNGSFRAAFDPAVRLSSDLQLWRDDMRGILQVRHDRVRQLAGKGFAARRVPVNRCMRPCAKCPCIFALCVSICLLLLICLGMVLMPMEVEPNFDSFLKTDVEASVMWDGYLEAVNSRSRSRRLAETQSVYMNREVVLIYQLDEGAFATGMLNERVLVWVRQFEERLRSLPAWQSLCARVAEDRRSLCDRGVSFANYAFAMSETAHAERLQGNLTLDGRGQEPVPLAAALALAKKHGLRSVFFPTRSDPEATLISDSATAPANATSPTTTRLRSFFRFTLPYGTSEDTLARQASAKDQLREEWKQFAEKTLIPALSEGFGAVGISDPQIGSLQVFFDGNAFEDIAVYDALRGDMALAGFSMAFVILYMIFHTQSILLSLLGLLIPVCSVPLAYVVCAMGGWNQVSFASFLAVFLTIGFGADTVLVYTDFWRESMFHHSELEDRLAWTYHTGGIASLATTGTTALSFLANLVSVIRALRQFGFFMGICVIFTWILVTVLYMPVLVLDELYLGRCQLHCRRRLISARGGAENPMDHPFAKWASHVRRWRPLYLFGFVAICIGSGITTLLTLELRLSTPGLFPADHNLNLMRGAEELFDTRKNAFGDGFEPLPQVDTVCDEHSVGVAGCGLHFCEAETGTSGFTPLTAQTSGPGRQLQAAQASSCECYRRERSPACLDTGDQTMEVTTKVVGSRSAASSLEETVRAMLLERNASSDENSQVMLSSLVMQDVAARLMVQEWSSGASSLGEIVVGTSVWRRLDVQASCGWEDLCFCGWTGCAMSDSWAQLPQVELPPVSPSARLLQDAVIPISLDRAARIFTAFGLKVSTDMPLLGNPDATWAFNEGFDIANPWTQRHIRTYCSSLHENTGLRVQASGCWVSAFESCLEDRGILFPAFATNFHDLAMECGAAESSLVWVTAGTVKATVVPAAVNVAKDAPSSTAFRLKEVWDAHVARMNAEGRAESSGAFHVSELWVEAESQGELISSSVWTVAILLILAFMGMIVFTHSLILSCFVVLATIGVLAEMMFVVVVVLQWQMGLLEGIAMIYFLGYAVTYSLHVAHYYAGRGASEFEPSVQRTNSLADRAAYLRLRRTTFALQSIGGATLGSGITTSGAAFFLVFCQLSIFQRLGSMCLIVSLISILVTLGPLPAGLLMCGPCYPGCNMKARVSRMGAKLNAKIEAASTQGRAPQGAATAQDERPPDGRSGRDDAGAGAGAGVTEALSPSAAAASPSAVAPVAGAGVGAIEVTVADGPGSPQPRKVIDLPEADRHPRSAGAGALDWEVDQWAVTEPEPEGGHQR